MTNTNTPPSLPSPDDDDGSSASLVRELPEVGHQDLVRDGSRRHHSGPAARPAPSSPPRRRPPSSSSYPSSIALSPLLRVSHDGRRRRGGRRRATGASSRPPHEEGRGEDATRGHIDDRIILFGHDVHHVVVVVVVQVQVLVGRPLLWERLFASRDENYGEWGKWFNPFC